MKNGATYRVTQDHVDGRVEEYRVFLGFTTPRGRRRVEARYMDAAFGRDSTVRAVELELVGPVCSGF